MKTMYIMCGLPGSGKSTYARKMVEKNRSTIIINKDAIRTMINGVYRFENDREPIVKEIVHSIIKGLNLQVDIIIDETNIKQEKRQNLVFIAHQYGYTPMIVYCKGNGKNLENRMTEPRGYTEKEWSDVIEKMKADFEEPRGMECSMMVVEEP